MYTLEQYGAMLMDPVRTAAYSAAIASAVRPGNVVVEIGTGPGFFALLACRAGARKVYAIETNPVLEIGRKIAAANGMAHAIEFLHADSRKVELAERADVVLSDIRGALPLHPAVFDTIDDARRRFLRPGGILIPQEDRLFACIVSGTKGRRELLGGFEDRDGLVLAEAREYLVNSDTTGLFSIEERITKPQSFWSLDYKREIERSVTAELVFKADRTDVASGIALWFATKLYEEVGFSSERADRLNVYNQLFLPWSEPVALQEGEEIGVTLRANPVGRDYIWRWDTTIHARAARPAKHFRQSNFFGSPFIAESLRKRARDFVPSLTDEGEAERWMLHAMDGKTPMAEIASEGAKRFPKVFPSVEDALRIAGDLAERLSR